MENDFGSSAETRGHSSASDVERMLQADRDRLLERVRVPGWLAPSFGLLAAAFVATPAFPGDEAGDVVLVVTIVASILLVSAFYRATGMKISRIGAREYALLGGGLIGELILLSVALGLAAAELHWWIIAPVVVAFALATGVTGAIVKSMRARLHHVR